MGGRKGVGGRSVWVRWRSGWEVGKEGEVVLGGGTDLNRCSCNTNVDSLHPFGQKTSVDLFPTCLNYTPSHTSTEVDLSDLGLLALYSEIHPNISYIVHYGVNMIAPVYKLQVRTQLCGVIIQGGWNRSGWSGFGQTTFLDEKIRWLLIQFFVYLTFST